MNVDATQTGIVFQYHQVQMIVGISCLVVVFQDVLNQGRYSKHPPFLISWIFGTILGLISRKGIFISKNSPFSAKN